MFSKPLNIVSVYLLTVINFLILILPFLIAVFPFMEIHGNIIKVNQYLVFNPIRALIFLLFLISFLMLFYLFLDFLFGFSLRVALKDCKRYDQVKNYEFLHEIFTEVKNKFDERGVRLYVRNSPEINAFAIGSLGRKVIVITHGLINHYLQNTTSREEFLIALRSIIGHEMSHLINKDFFPGLIIIINQRVTNMVSGIIRRLFLLILEITSLIRLESRYINAAMMWIYDLSNRVLTAFNRYIVYGIYELLRKFASRSIEYRADRQSAQAFGGISMAFALSLLGKSGYFTLFSTHPATKRRIKKVKDIKEKNCLITPDILSMIFYYLSLILLILISLICARLSRIDQMIRKFLLLNYEPVYQKLSAIFLFIKKFMIY